MQVDPDVALLAGLSAAALATVDIAFTAQRRISPVYLLDAGPEVALAAWWSGAGRRNACSEGEEATNARRPHQNGGPRGRWRGQPRRGRRRAGGERTAVGWRCGRRLAPCGECG